MILSSSQGSAQRLVQFHGAMVGPVRAGALVPATAAIVLVLTCPNQECSYFVHCARTVALVNQSLARPLGTRCQILQCQNRLVVRGTTFM